MTKQSFSTTIPEGDSRDRSVCNTCGFIDYQNPKIVAGAIVSFDHKILLCKRAIEPRVGFWTMPAGYIENHESPQDGAIREAREEALADIKIDQLLGIFTVARLSQVQMIYRAELSDGNFGIGEETLDAKLFAWDDIPWGELAFPSVNWALERWKEAEGQERFIPSEFNFQHSAALK